MELSPDPRKDIKTAIEDTQSLEELNAVLDKFADFKDTKFSSIAFNPTGEFQPLEQEVSHFDPALQKVKYRCIKTARVAADSLCICVLPDDRIVSGHINGGFVVSKFDQGWSSKYCGGSNEGRVQAIVASGNDKILTGSADKTIQTWQLNDYSLVSPELVGTLNAEVIGLHIMPDGRLLSGSADGVLQVWEQAKNGIWYSAELLKHPAGLRAVAAHGGDTIAIVDGEGFVFALESVVANQIKMTQLGYVGEEVLAEKDRLPPLEVPRKDLIIWGSWIDDIFSDGSRAHGPSQIVSHTRAENGEWERTIEREHHGEPIRFVRFLGEDQILWGGSKKLHITQEGWFGKTTGTLKGYKGDFRALKVVSENRLVTLSSDGYMCLWDGKIV